MLNNFNGDISKVEMAKLVYMPYMTIEKVPDSIFMSSLPRSGTYCF